jgi:hypothetical protein
MLGAKNEFEEIGDFHFDKHFQLKHQFTIGIDICCMPVMMVSLSQTPFELLDRQP